MLDSPQGDPGHPPLTSPLALLRWLTRRQAPLLVVATAVAVVNFLTFAALPLLLGTALDQGLSDGLSRGLVLTCAGIVAVGLVQALTSSLGHIGEVGAWLNGAMPTARLVGHHVTRTGDAISDTLPTGEVVATVASDAFHIGNLMERLPRFVGSVTAYLVVAGILLTQSVPLGLAVLVGLPVTTVILALLVRPLHRRQAAHREATGRLTTLGNDTVAGLRVLRGIGGEDVFAARYAEQSQRVRRAGVAVAATQSILEALQVLLPGLLVVGVVWFGARLAMTGQITPGQLVTFYGYTAFLSMPLRATTQFIQMFTRARVGAKKVIDVLSVVPAAGTLDESREADEPAAGPVAGRQPVDGHQAAPAPEQGSRTPAAAAGDGRLAAPAAGDDRTAAPAGAELLDTATGVRIHPGRLTAVVSARPDDAAALATRLARIDDAQPVATYGGVPLRDLPLAEARRRIVLAGATPQLFTGTLREELDVRERATERDLYDALETADGHDVLASMPEGLDGEITEKGRSLSGGQRQRVALARALLTDAETLLLVEPTSAVDAHTEARIAARLAERRRGRTTVVVTASPLVLEHADEVVLLDGDHEVARGRHRDLLRRAAAGEPAAAAYAAVVSRSTGAEMQEVH
ncbi:ABC transporter ATP-binding protein/permease [Georgenia sp. TF02-10]|uniref:ABC transporter ATP-binding protein n=1 Tax=Georgenia sp. TF02-10 TaxID=2917725 RepID=UPI001FA6BE11|nr:ABC transporter ATP-binding protein [Georgenia sp. TF02-10]UNX54284.1 ABC transporter ATP-binding protein/permease [Georgenia sp. TF02-10]